MRADLAAAMSDPARNHNFLRGWTDPPDPKRERRAQAGTPDAATLKSAEHAHNIEADFADQARCWMARAGTP